MMSSLTTIKMKHKLGFVCRESLEGALKAHNISLDSELAIIESQGKFQLTSSKQVRNGQVQLTSEQLTTKLDEIVKKILPAYTRLLAIKDFQAQNFSLVRERSEREGQILVFEREKSLVEGGQFERLIVTIRPDQTLTIDAENFTGRSCLDATGGFENRIGRVVSRELKPEYQMTRQSSSNLQNRTKRLQKKQLRI